MKTWHKLVLAALVIGVAYFVYKWATRPGGITATKADKGQTGSVVTLDVGAPTDASNQTVTSSTTNASPAAAAVAIDGREYQVVDPNAVATDA